MFTKKENIKKLIGAAFAFCLFTAIPVWSATPTSPAIDASTPQQPRSIDDFLEDFEAYCENYRTVFDVPGMHIVIVKDGHVFHKSFGTLSITDSTPVSKDTVFQVASLTKNFTSALIARLHEKKILSLDDKVTQYLPHFKLANPNVTADLRIRDLLCHRTGFEPFAGDSFWHGGLSADEIIENMQHLPLPHPFREVYGYSNLLVGIAGHIVEKATGESLDTVIQRELFTPIGIENSSMKDLHIHEPKSVWQKVKNMLGLGDSDAPFAYPHDLHQGKAHSIDAQDLYVFPGTSGLNTTGTDMARWMMWRLNGFKDTDGRVMLSQNTVDQIRHPYVDGTKDLLGMQFPKERTTSVKLGLGWFLHDFGSPHRRIQCLSQMGGSGGVRSLITIVPSENLGIVVLSNLGGMRSSLLPEGLIQTFLDMYLGIDKGHHPGIQPIDFAKRIREKYLKLNTKIKRQIDMMRLKNVRPHAELKRYTGIYENPIYGKATVTLSDQDNLMMNYRNHTFPITHFNGHRFTAADARSIGVGFETDDSCFITFGLEDDQFAQNPAFGLMIELLDEGENSAFYRVEEEKDKQ